MSRVITGVLACSGSAALPSSDVARDHLIVSCPVRVHGGGAEEELVGGVAGVIGGEARVEDEEGGGVLGPWPEGLEGAVQGAGEDDGLVEVDGVAPRDGEGPVLGLVVAYHLLQQPRLVGFRRCHELAEGLVARH